MPLKPSDILERSTKQIVQDVVNIIDKKLIDKYDPRDGNVFTFNFLPKTPQNVIDAIAAIYKRNGWKVTLDENTLILDIYTTAKSKNDDVRPGELSIFDLLKCNAIMKSIKHISQNQNDCVLEFIGETEGGIVSQQISLVTLMHLLNITPTQAHNAADGLSAYIGDSQ